ncbi:MAG: mhpB [Frankiales bacterium]|nr:mhpB [Frankiales bacterium]
MTLALCALSHSPLMHTNAPPPDIAEAAFGAMADARRFVEDYDPELVVLLAPDHYNGFFYDVMPPFCIGLTACGVGDYGTSRIPLSVDRKAASQLLADVLASDLDIAMSERMSADHGIVQPLEVLFGGTDAVDVVPVFINCVAEPLGPVRRIRRLGTALGRSAAGMGKRVLFVASGGLSHDPPVPRLEDAPPEVAERLIAGRNPTPEQRATRESRVLQAGLDFAAGIAPLRPINPAWDQRFLRLLRDGRFDEIDGWPNSEFVAQGGHSAHEVRTWIAAYAALAEAGPYEVTSSFYRPIPEWIAGFAVTTAREVTH